MYTGHTIVKAFGHERKSIEKFNAVNEKVYEASWRAQFISGLLFPLMTFINNIGYVAVAVAGGIMVTRKAIAIGDIQAFIQYSRQFTMPIAQTANIANILQSTVASAERVFELLDETEEVPDGRDVRSISPLPKGDVRFEDVRFSYKEDVPLIEGDEPRREGRARPSPSSGPTGAGKTTLVNLLMRFYEIQGGRITVDGMDIRGRAAREPALHLRHGAAGHVAVQRHHPRQHRLRPRRSHRRGGQAGGHRGSRGPLHPHAPGRLRTRVLNEEASNISQGQRQLLTIARAVLIDPAILILDEATSSVDTRTEVLIQKAMATPDEGAHELRHRAPALHDPRCEADPRDEPRRDHRDRDAQGAAGTGRLLRGAVQQPVHRGEPGGGSSVREKCRKLAAGERRKFATQLTPVWLPGTFRPS